jgi:hypothetical protein
MEPKKSHRILPIFSLIVLITSICSTTTAATPADINEAVSNGIVWLVLQQQGDGSWYDPVNHEPVACTGFAVTKLADRAFELAMEPNSNIDPQLGPFDPNYIYKYAVESGLNFIFQNCSIVDIYNQTAGNPDTDSDSNGVRFGDDYRTIYSTGICMMAIASTRAPDMEVNCPNSPVHGWTYKELLSDTVDFMAFAQTDYPNTGRGGWRYRGQDPDADNSNTGYAVLGLAYAESRPYGFNCVVPQFVKDELKIYIDFIQCDIDGSSGYEQPCDWPNILKNGNLILEMIFAGISVGDPNLGWALDYIERTWNDSSNDPGWGNPAYGGTPHYQATFCAMRGLEYARIDTIVVDGNERDWYADFADAIVDTQQGNGSWPNDPWGGTILATEWALLTLERTAPASCIVALTKTDDINNCVGPGDYITYTIDYNYPAGQNCLGINDVNIIDYLPPEVDFNWADSNGIYDPYSNTVTWYIGTLSPGDVNRVTLKVDVKPCVEPCITITNECEIKSENNPIGSASEHTPVCCPTLTKVDDINDGNCVASDVNITYHICYAANGYPDSNVRITDSLPQSVEFISADSNGSYNTDTHTVTWIIGTLDDDESGCVYLTVRVGRCVESCCEITNCCDMTGDYIRNVTACESTPVCNLVVDDIEQYDPYAYWDTNSIWNTWSDGQTNGSGSNIGYWNGPPYTELTTVHGGNQSMPYYYGDYFEWYGPKGNAYYSEAYAVTADLPSGIGSDWTVEDVEALELWFYGDTDNDANAAESMYVALEDSSGTKVLAYHNDPYELLESSWHSWVIDLEDFNDGGVDLTDVQKIYIGFGDPCSTSPSGKYGLVYFDDILLCKSMCKLSLENTASFNGDCVGPSDEITYIIDYNNFSVVARTDVKIIDELPIEVEFISADSNGAYDPCSHTVTWDIDTLGPDESGFVTLTVEIKCPGPGGTITNKCEIRSSDVLHNTDYEHTPVCCCPTLTKVDDVDGCVGRGDYITYSICYDANGYGDTNVIITDELPPELEFISASGNYSQPDSNTVIWYMGTLEANESNCVTLTVKVVGCVEPYSTIRNCCEMTGDCLTSTITACENTSVCGPPTLTKADNLDNGEYACPDGHITYSLCYSANGYGDTNVEIVDELPPEVNYISSDPCGFNDPCSGTVTWGIGTLDSGDSGCLELVVQVNTSAEPDTTIINQCRMTGDCISNLNINITATEDTLICPVCSSAGLYVNEVMADEPALWLRFEDYPFVDSSGNDYWVDGAANIEKTPGSMGKAAYFNGGYVAAADQQTEPNLPTDFNDAYAFAPNDISFELWFKADTGLDDYAAFFNQAETKYHHPAPYAVVQDRAPAAGRYSTQIRAMTYARTEEFGNECWRYTDPNVSVWPTDGDWHHLVVTYDEHAGGLDTILNVKMYLDTELVIDDANSGGGTVGPEMDHILIGNLGSRNLQGLNPYKGYIDEFAIYPGLLSPCRVATHYAAWQPKNCKEMRDRLLIWDIDRNQDCRIDFYDFAIFAQDWMLCNDPESIGINPNCVPNW